AANDDPAVGLQRERAHAPRGVASCSCRLPQGGEPSIPEEGIGSTGQTAQAGDESGGAAVVVPGATPRKDLAVGLDRDRRDSTWIEGLAAGEVATGQCHNTAVPEQ